ncbi:MAG: hypothetical protein WCK90_04195 [archaeon]
MDEKASEIYRTSLNAGSLVELMLDENTVVQGRGEFADSCLSRYLTPENPAGKVGIVLPGYVVHKSISTKCISIASGWDKKTNSPMMQNGYNIVDYGAIIEVRMHRIVEEDSDVKTPLCACAILPKESIRQSGKLD